jgi:hypothetical protein
MKVKWMKLSLVVALALSYLVFAILQANAASIEEQLRNALTKATVNSMLREDYTAGKTFEKTFANQKVFKEAMSAAELYKTSKTIENAISINIMPFLIQRIGDKYFLQYPPVGLENRYSMAVRDLIAAIHSGDKERLKKYTQEIEEMITELRTKGWISTGEGEYKVYQVNTDLITIYLKQLSMWSYENLYSKVQEAFKQMSYSELVRFYNENKHLFSKEEREIIRNILKKFD